MADQQKQAWWKELLRKEVVAGHVVNALVGLAVGFVVGLVMTLLWVAWSAWHHSVIWTERAIGASMAFSISILATAATLAILRRRLNPTATRATKGYLDHKVDSSKGSAAIGKILTDITKITLREVAETKAGNARLIKIYKLPPGGKRLAKEIAATRRSAVASDKATRQLAKKLPLLAAAAEKYSQAELAYWKWHTANHKIDRENATARIALLEKEIKTIQENVDARTGSKNATSGRLGVSQVLNESVERRLVVLDGLSAAMASQIAPLQEIITLLEPFAAAP